MSGFKKSSKILKKISNRSKYFIGIDEAGRGPLAGPLTVAAVLMPAKNGKIFKGIKDSKKLTSKKREEWFGFFSAPTRGRFGYSGKGGPVSGGKEFSCLKFAVSSVGPDIIDRKGISWATKVAVGRVLKKLEKKFSILNTRYLILLDGSLYAPKKYLNQKTIIRGDELVPIISAASIVAKVTRDRKMKRLAKKYPKYGFETHKGYGTFAHEFAIKKNGFCDIHRRSFCRKFM